MNRPLKKPPRPQDSFAVLIIRPRFTTRLKTMKKSQNNFPAGT